MQRGRREATHGDIKARTRSLVAVGTIAALGPSSHACAAKRVAHCDQVGSLHEGMTQQEVLAIPEFSWPTIYARSCG